MPVMPLRVLASPTGPPQGPFAPLALFVARLAATTIPSDVRCAPLVFTIGLYEPRCPDRGPRRRTSRVPPFSVHACCAPYPAETDTLYISGQERCRRGLHREMTGSALGL